MGGKNMDAIVDSISQVTKRNMSVCNVSSVAKEKDPGVAQSIQKNALDNVVSLNVCSMHQKEEFESRTVRTRSEQKKKFLQVLRDGAKDQREKKVSLLKSTDMRTALIAKQLLSAYNTKSVVAWRSFLVPSEIMYAAGAKPFTPEMSCAAVAQCQPAIRNSIQKAEENQYEPKLCSFLKTTIGGVHEGIMPTPDLVIGSPSYCSGIGSVLHDVSRFYGSDYFYLNIPQDTSAESVEYVAAQLKRLTALLCKKTGMSIHEVEKERLPKTIELSNEAAGYWKKIEQLRKTVPSPMPSREALDYATVLSQTWGSEEIVEIYRLLHSELKARVESSSHDQPEEKLRLLWLHLRPYYDNKIFDILEEHKAVIAFEEVNYPSRHEMDPSNPYQSLAREILSGGGQYRKSLNRAQDLEELAEEFKVDGVIHFSHDNCEWTKNTYPVVSEFLNQKRGLPILNLSSDCLVDERSELLRTRLSAFLEGLKARQSMQSCNTSEKEKYSALPLTTTKECHMGIDVGSSAIKVVVFSQNGRGTILGSSIIPTGSDNKRAIEKASHDALSMAGGMKIGNCKNIVATGVGREGVSFANDVLTEITCHSEGMKYLFPGVKTIVEIGGQDTKVILSEEARFRMNDACAAGTGKFLAAMAQALGIGLEDLSDYDKDAKKSLTLSRMCTVFAESEVVSLIARGASVNDVVRGIHEMVVSRTITLLKQLTPKIITPIAMSGGVALNRGVVRALESGLGEKIYIPENPQIIGALGAAIIGANNNKRNRG
jgi:predicted CoA-substrate-specific enzyme activase